ncbi:MAG: hypothetical protein QG574_2838 [Cyanobacteriota bacterium erpe_2018_sw_21hr_WHONDRS-SW48-000092_B_bin.40]|nr:hypothetical protein [Cyanobacteriota bacterium erpe_2018_sw_21hr_WHONDRS-SW48-000092_B_bin.40]
MKRIVVNYIAAPLAALGLAVGSAPVNAAPTQEGLYVLHFPARGKIGTVGVAEAGADYSGKHVPTKKFAEANGTVRLAKGKGICFIATDFMGLEKPVDVICTLPAEAVTSITLSNNIFDENEILKLLRFAGLKRLELTGTEVTDETIAKLAPLQNLETLIVDRTRIQGKFLAKLSSNKSIRNLKLGHNDLQKQYLNELKKFPNLHSLTLNSNHLRDSDMAAIAACSHLRYLDISDNNDLTNAGIAQLKPLKELAIMQLPFTAINAKGILALKGLPLARLRIEPKQANTKDVAALNKAFPKLQIDFENLKKELFNDYKAAFQ